MRIRLYQIALPFDQDEKSLRKKALEKAGIREQDLLDWKIVKRSLDARKKPSWICTLDLEIAEGTKLSAGVEILDSNAGNEADMVYGNRPLTHRPVVVGAGPAGLFAAYWLAQNGYAPLLLEQGQEIAKRKKAIDDFHQTRHLNSMSNYVFGEGGAGAYSDGKLNTGVGSPLLAKILAIMVEKGAPPEIAYVSPPHIGSDRLRGVMIRLRQQIIAWGGEFRFETCVTGLTREEGKIKALLTEKETIPTDTVLWATGSHAPDTFAMLYACGIPMHAKPFQMGVRIEHPQDLIDRKQYGRYAGHPRLTPATYRLATDRSEEYRQVCSFCMCPGGEIICATGTPGCLVTNGMSNYHQDSPFANSALITTFTATDFGGEHPLAGLLYRQQIEEKAFRAAGNDYKVPFQKAADFLQNKITSAPFHSSYRLGGKACRFSDFLPLPLLSALRFALPQFDKKIPHFIDEGTLLAPETRASSPIRIDRDPKTLESGACANLYPVGEGAGYAGGIMSAAVDGIHAAQKLMAKWQRPTQ